MLNTYKQSPDITDQVQKLTAKLDKTCHTDRIARLTAPCPAHKKLQRKTITFANANADANANAGGSTIALPGLCPGKLKMQCYTNCKVRDLDLCQDDSN